MRLKYNCPGCGTPLGYDGLCWKCKCEQERKDALSWTSEQIAEKQKKLTINIQRLGDMEDHVHPALLHGDADIGRPCRGAGQVGEIGRASCRERV